MTDIKVIQRRRAAVAYLIAAIEDAISYRLDQGGCIDCKYARPGKCSDHVFDDELATAYQALLTGLTTRKHNHDPENDRQQGGSDKDIDQ